MIKTIVFDLDGTLVDTVDMWTLVWVESFAKHGVRLKSEQARKYVGLPAGSIIKAVIGKTDKDLEAKIIKEKDELMWKYAYMAKLFDDVKPAFQDIKNKDIKIAVASSSLEEWIEAMLDRACIKKFVCCYLSSNKVARPKPAPDVFLEAFRIAGTSPKEGMVVGDRESDTIPGIEIGSISVLIDRRKEFKNARADYVINSMAELSNLY